MNTSQELADFKEAYTKYLSAKIDYPLMNNPKPWCCDYGVSVDEGSKISEFWDREFSRIGK